MGEYKSRICMYFGPRCNINCQYCYRADARTDVDNNVLTDKMKKFLSNLSPELHSAVVAGGGEPLLYFNEIKDVFSYVPDNIHKKIMSNGTLLTQEVVDYANENDIELSISHDGKHTNYLRGVDVLLDANILALIKQIKVLTIQSVITNINCDIIENYEYIKKYIGRDVMMMTFPIYETSKNMHLVENFNYDLFRKSMIKYKNSINYVFYQNYLKKDRIHSLNINYLLNGDAVASILLNPTHADVTDMDTVIKNYKELYEKECPNPHCSIKKFCEIKKDLISPHMCKIEHINSDIQYRGGFFL